MTIPPQLAIIIEYHSRRSVLRLQGELDAANQDCLRRAIRTVLDHHSPQILVLDLSELGFTDCAGLGAMVRTHKHLAEQGRELVLTGIQPLTRRLLGLTGLDTHLHVSTPKTLDSPDKSPSRQHADTKKPAPPDSGTSRWRTFPHAGERLTRPVLDYLRSGVQAGMVISDAADNTLGSVRVRTE